MALDQQGQLFGIWQSAEHTGVTIYNEPGALIWNEAAVDDIDAAKRFYGEVFGFGFDEVEGAGGYATFSTGDRPLGGLGSHQPGLPKGWSSCFSVASADDAVAVVQAHGGTVLMPAADTPFARFAVVEDPWGAALSVMQDLPG
ncbi:MAG: VOC family protein, partial [Mycobacteriales bacterium]